MKNNCILFLLFAVSFFSGCSPAPTVELEEIAKVKRHLDSVQMYLEVDESVLKERIDYINLDFQVIRQYYRDTITLEFGNTMDRYKQIKKIYSSYLSNSDRFQKEYNDLNRQLILLKNSVQDRRISSDSFHYYLAEESSQVNILFQQAKSKGEFVLTVEPEYTRITKFIEPIIQALRIENETVNTLYKGLEGH